MAPQRNMATPTPSQTCLLWAGQPLPILALGQWEHLALPGDVHLRDFDCIPERAHGSLCQEPGFCVLCLGPRV